METIKRRMNDLCDHSARCRRDLMRPGTALMLAAMLVIVGVLDVISTNASLAAGNTEDNPLVAALQHHWGAWWFVPKLLVHAALAGIVLWLPTRNMIRNARAGIILYTAIIVSNFHVADWTI